MHVYYRRSLGKLRRRMDGYLRLIDREVEELFHMPYELAFREIWGCYVMFASLGLALHREKTCAAGDGLCDFKIKRHGPIPEVWPPHGLDDRDTLK